MANKLVKQKPRFSVAIQSDAYKRLINQTLGDPKRAAKFITNISSAVAVNPNLQECDAGTILSGGLLGESLNLSPSPQLGHFYLVPFEDKIRGKLAQFIIGYKGYIQLALRSGVYRKLNVIDIKEGELVGIDLLNEEITAMMIEDPVKREKAKTVGYYAMFELNESHGGFKKILYWSREKMEAHAKKYSKGYANDLEKGTKWTFWSKDFDGMAFKTMLRQLISKWGIMSTEMQTAFERDMAVIKEHDDYEYVDNLDLEEPLITNDSSFNNANEVSQKENNTKSSIKGFEKESSKEVAETEIVEHIPAKKGKAKDPEEFSFKL